MPELSPDERKALAEGAGHEAWYSYINNIIHVAGNSTRPIASFDSMHGCFRTAGPPESKADITILFRQEGRPGSSVTFLVNDRAYRIRSEELIAAVHSTMMYLVMKHVRSHYLIHAGCLSREGRGLVLAGRSGMGKSTLTAHLAARGMGFLSDELAALNRRTGLLDAAPMLIGIRPGPARNLVDEGRSLDYSFRGDRKKLVGIEDLSGRPAAGSVPPGPIVFLTADRGRSVSTAKKFDGPVKVITTGTGEDFEGALLAPAGVSLKERGESESCPFFVLEVSDPGSFLPHLTSVLKDHGIELVDMLYEDLGDPDFTGMPELTPLPPAVGVLELLKKIPSFNMRELARADFEGKSSLLIAELSSLLRDASFYKLSPGKIEAQVACLEQLSA